MIYDKEKLEALCRMERWDEYLEKNGGFNVKRSRDKLNLGKYYSRVVAKDVLISITLLNR